MVSLSNPERLSHGNHSSNSPFDKLRANGEFLSESLPAVRGELVEP
jgi:hypothetical protein